MMTESQKWYAMRKENESRHLNGHILFWKIILQFETHWHHLLIYASFSFLFNAKLCKKGGGMETKSLYGKEQALS